MADTTSQTPPSTVAPDDSASSAGKKKSKPGKAERAVRRSQVGSASGAPASAAKAAAFASGSPSVKPQPGKYPVVFQTGAGEPSRDKSFAFDGGVLGQVLLGFPSRFVSNAKYNEFKANAGVTDGEFSRDLTVAALLALAQQVVHSHTNMGLPQGDFAPVASTDVRIPPSVAAYVRQFGEHSVPALGTRFLLSDYSTTVKRLVWTADRLRGTGPRGPFERFWLPTNPDDGHTKAVVADALRQFLSRADLAIPDGLLERDVLSGQVPVYWDEVKSAFGQGPAVAGTPDLRDRFDFLFNRYGDAGQFYTAYTQPGRDAVLREIGLPWNNPDAGHLDWGFNVKERFTWLADEWAKRSAAYAQFFELTSTLANRNSASGSQAQMATVSDFQSVTIVRAYLALSAPEFSLLACFPPSCVYTHDLPRLVVLTTPLSVSQRATEFCQLDWR